MRDRRDDHTHRQRAEAKLGRKLKKTEVVHHKNEDKSDNSDVNLQVDDRGKHTADHNKNRGLSALRASLRMTKEGRKLY